MTASRNRTEAPFAVSRKTGRVATLPTAQIIVSFIVAIPSPARHVTAPGGQPHGGLPYGPGDRVRRDRRPARLPRPERRRAGLWTPARLWTTPSPHRLRHPTVVVPAPITRPYCSRTSR
ncbi:hypothetical protein GCM10023220_32020 [Streptomyces ziwulingensis]|uniref:Uncharacterized protein n=1 Tax=Streptomyces ziwulingensis TaxID=1045501 RepID=A0ABP9BW62_9ACTN